MCIRDSLQGNTWPDASLDTIVWEIRLPRILTAAMTGVALSISGAVFQEMCIRDRKESVEETIETILITEENVDEYIEKYIDLGIITQEEYDAVK